MSESQDPDESTERPVVGHTIIAENMEPNNFECYAVLTGDSKDDRSLMEPGTVFEIEEGNDDRCFGIVEESQRWSERDVIAEELSRRGAPDKDPMTSTLVRLKTFRESGMSSPVGRFDIRPASAEGIRIAYGIPEQGIPVGRYTLPSGIPSESATVRIPPNFLLGPETAHMNIGGKSGYGKTAMGLVTAKSVLSHPETRDNTAVIAFNVKSDDLLYPDQPNTEHTDRDREIYNEIGVDRTPFDDVIITAPEHPSRRGQPRSERIDAEPFSLTWDDIGDQYRLLISSDDINDNFARLVNELATADNLRTFQQVADQLENALLAAGSANTTTVFDHDDANRHNTATIRKGIRIFEGLVDDNPGFLDGHSDPLDIDEMLTNGRLTVVDIDKCRPKQKRAVVSLVRREVQDRLDRRVADVDNVLTVADELNKFAPRSATNQAIKEVKNDIVDMAERGRSIGTALLGIEQRPSKIDQSVTENVATMAFSRLRMTEMDNRLYQTLSNEKKETVTRLEAGYMMIDFDNFQEPVLTRYPRPPCAQEQPDVFESAGEVWRSVPEARREQSVEHLLNGMDEGWENADEVLAELEELHADQEALDNLRAAIEGE
jgi:hypothetical protein